MIDHPNTRTRSSAGCFQPTGTPESSLSVEERFWPKVNKNGPTIREELGQCWVWTARMHPSGYGSFKFDKKRMNAHRVSWSLTFSHPKDRDVLHRCDNRACVRPEHLFLGTQQDNVADMMAKGRHRKPAPGRHRYVTHLGKEHGMAKLEDNDVREIRLTASVGATNRGQARLYGVSGRTIKRIVQLENWKHIT